MASIDYNWSTCYQIILLLRVTKTTIVAWKFEKWQAPFQKCYRRAEKRLYFYLRHSARVEILSWPGPNLGIYRGRTKPQMKRLARPKPTSWPSLDPTWHRSFCESQPYWISASAILKFLLMSSSIPSRIIFEIENVVQVIYFNSINKYFELNLILRLHLNQVWTF